MSQSYGRRERALALGESVVQAGGMSTIPTPIRAALGLAATAIDEAKKLPESLPHAVTTVPMLAVSTAMQASLKVQQHIAVLTARGDEVLSQLRGASEEPPAWATFDDAPSSGDADATTGQSAGAAAPAKAAFDRIDYHDVDFTENDGSTGRWAAIGDTEEAGATDDAGSDDVKADDAGATSPASWSARPQTVAGPVHREPPGRADDAAR